MACIFQRYRYRFYVSRDPSGSKIYSFPGSSHLKSCSDTLFPADWRKHGQPVKSELATRYTPTASKSCRPDCCSVGDYLCITSFACTESLPAAYISYAFAHLSPPLAPAGYNAGNPISEWSKAYGGIRT